MYQDKKPLSKEQMRKIITRLREERNEYRERALLAERDNTEFKARLDALDALGKTRNLLEIGDKVLLQVADKGNRFSWIEGKVVGFASGDIGEDFQRVNVFLKTGRMAKRCHPNCIAKLDSNGRIIE